VEKRGQIKRRNDNYGKNRGEDFFSLYCGLFHVVRKEKKKTTREKRK